MKRLINLLPPFENESLNSYLKRLGVANHYKEMNWVNSLINLPHSRLNYIYKKEHLAALSSLVSLDISTLRSMTIHGYAKYFYFKDGCLPLNLSIQDSKDLMWEHAGLTILVAGNSIRTKVCPKCYESTGAYLLPWLLLPVTVCPIHKILLVDTCSLCRNPLNLNGAFCSKCGLHIGRMKSIEIKNDSVGMTLTNLVWSEINPDNESSQKTKEFPFSELSSAQFFQLLWKLSNLLLKYDSENNRFKRDDFFGVPNASGHRKSLTALDVRGVYDAMATTCELLMNWPNNWHKVLTRIASSETARRVLQRGNPETIKKRHSFACNLHKVIRNVDMWMWLWDSFVQFSNSSINDNDPSIKYWKKYIRYSESRLWESENRKRFQITHKTKNHFQQPPTWQVNSCEEKSQLNGRQVNHDSSELLNLQEAYSYLGISHRHMLNLCKAGVIIAEPRNSPRSQAKWRFNKKKIDIVIQKILKNLPAQYPPSHTNSSFLPLTKAFRKSGYARVSFLDLLNAVLNGDLRAQYDPRIKGLKAIWLYEKDLVVFLRHWKNSDCADFTPFYKAFIELKISDTTLMSFAHSGLLVPAKGYPNLPHPKWLYDPDDLEWYRKTIIKSDVAASIVGWTQSTVAKWTAKGWIKAVSGPNVDGLHYNRYDRDALNQWRHDRLTSTEVHKLLGINRHTLERWVARGDLQPIRNAPTHFYWFYRKDIEKMKKTIVSPPKKHIPRNYYNVRIYKRSLRLTDSQAQQLLNEYNECTFTPTRTRLLAVYLYGLGHSYGEIMDLAGCSRSRICLWCKKYREQGIEGLRDKRRGSR